MSTNYANAGLSLAQDARPGWVDTLFGRGRQVWSALAEGKAAADRYQSLVGRGMAPGEAGEVVFREHFGRR